MTKHEHWYLISYDIRQKNRLQRLHRFLKRFGFAVQESVFLFAGTKDQWHTLKKGVEQRIKKKEDDVRVYRLPAGSCLHFTGSLPWPDGVFFGGLPAFTHKALTSSSTRD